MDEFPDRSVIKEVGKILEDVKKWNTFVNLLIKKKEMRKDWKDRHSEIPAMELFQYILEDQTTDNHGFFRPFTLKHLIEVLKTSQQFESIGSKYEKQHKVSAKPNPEAEKETPRHLEIVQQGSNGVQRSNETRGEEVVFKLDKVQLGDIVTPNCALRVRNQITEIKGFKIQIPDGGTDNSYKNLLGRFLTQEIFTVSLEDPYIRTEYQLNNFRSFVKTVIKCCPNVTNIHLTTASQNIKTGNEQQVQMLKAENEKQVKELNSICQYFRQNGSKRPLSITWKLDTNIHARILKLNNGWTWNRWELHMDRGLDIYYYRHRKPSDRRYENFASRSCRKSYILVIEPFHPLW